MVKIEPIRPEIFIATETVTGKLFPVSGPDDIAKNLANKDDIVALHGTTAQSVADLLQWSRLRRMDESTDNIGFHAVPILGRKALQSAFNSAGYENNRALQRTSIDLALDYADTLPADLSGMPTYKLPEQFKYPIVLGISEIALRGRNARILDPTHEDYPQVPELVFKEAPNIDEIPVIFLVGEDSSNFVYNLIDQSVSINRKSLA